MARGANEADPDGYHRISEALRHAVDPPREYPNVCYNRGPGYYDYRDYPLDATLDAAAFRVHDFVGRGTFARCYASTLASDPDGDKNLCIKVLRRTKEKHYHKLRRELSILQHLQGYPGVVHFRGLLHDDQCRLWLLNPQEFENIEKEDHDQMQQLNVTSSSRFRVAMVFDLIKDVQWKRALMNKSPNTMVTNEQLSFFLWQILLTLDCAHENGIMHRDIKPPNCLLDVKNERVTVVDWGQAEYFIPYVQHNVQVGGRSYKAPELVYGGSHIRGLHDYGVDVWAFGVMMASLVLFGGNNNLFWASDREGVIQSISGLLGTRDLIEYLRQRPYILLSELTHDLCSIDPTPRESPIAASGLVKELLADTESQEHIKSRWTPDALSLIEKLLQYDPARRPTCREMMIQEPYFEPARTRIQSDFGIRFNSDEHVFSSTNTAAIMQAREAFKTPLVFIPNLDAIRLTSE